MKLTFLTSCMSDCPQRHWFRPKLLSIVFEYNSHTAVKYYFSNEVLFFTTLTSCFYMNSTVITVDMLNEHEVYATFFFLFFCTILRQHGCTFFF